ncbi:hypothetical protein TWF730_006120 [Orbilia blumenaviensis]|uniref:Phosphoribosyltransferase domain-containing protein n=1 Tax=Orbilia blumenaviensis TaxID=1796055 RepID=A0AAV9TWQ2_9PEZI
MSIATQKKATIVGIYGIPGSGKSFVLRELERELGSNMFQFYEGSQVIAELVPGGLEEFKKLEDREKTNWRQIAIQSIGKHCLDNNLVGIVAGHYMFWDEDSNWGQPVFTKEDGNIFTHIIYLDVPADVASEQRINDKNRVRPSCSLQHLQKWKETEKEELRDLCYQNKILFSVVSPWSKILEQIKRLLDNFSKHREEYNRACVEDEVDKILEDFSEIQTMLVLDGDRTLSEEDTGRIFWDLVFQEKGLTNQVPPLKRLFGSSLGYSYTAFRQAALLYQGVAEESDFDRLCRNVASSIVIYPEFLQLLKKVLEHKHVGAVVVTCGLRLVWEKIIERQGLAGKIKVIGGGRLADKLVIDAAAKTVVVKRLKMHGVYVFAFGDSILDLPMLSKADEAIVVVGGEKTRSKTMDAALLNTLETGILSARQALLPSDVAPRLNLTLLPTVKFTDIKFIDSITCSRRQNIAQILHTTNRNSAKILMTPMRDAKIAGPALREAHRRVGWYLATEFLMDIIGIEEYPITHVQSNKTSGYRLLDESTTLIVALMRGGEPMALGVNDAFPTARFLHAKNPENLRLEHLPQQGSVILVDSVVNSGKTIVEFVRRITHLHSTIRIVVVAGVVQKQSITDGSLAQEVRNRRNINIVALRLSENKFTGKGNTDTGNRLFNTTHI